MTSSSWASSIISNPIPKWQLALVVGAPVALGLGYVYYKNNSKPSLKPTRDQLKDGVNEHLTKSDKQISIDGDVTSSSAEPPSEDPMKKAQKFKEMGNKYFNDGKYDEAILQYSKAIETCLEGNPTELSIFYQNRAAAYTKLKKYSAVKADCSKALELNPRYIKALIRRSHALEECNDLETALEDITAACILERFANEHSLFFADKLLKELGRQHAQEFMATKEPVMPSKHFIKTYFEALRNDPILKEYDIISQNLTSEYAKAVQCVKNQNYEKVIPHCNKELESLQADSTSDLKMKVHLLRGTFHLLLGEHDKAMSDLNTVIMSDSANKDLKVNALIKRASMHVQLENPEKSFCDFSEAIELDSNCGDIYHNRAQVNLLLERIDEAKADFEKAAQLHPNSGLFYVQKCYADYRYATTKKDQYLLQSSMQDFQKAFEKFPDCSECYTLYAQILCDSQEYEQADEYFTKAMEKDPQNATIYVHKGLLQLHWNTNIDKAVEYIKNALELDDKCEFGYETLGSIEVQRGNLKEAINLFDKALMLGRTTMEVTHIFSLKDAAKTQLTVSERLGMNLISNIH
ncbi:mitochondrial import receptor subunit TOM70 [Leptopilina heterotoma]|uniref:mitochondrial import receptor subunit TOM70 n=1 Tax=Leptopilina heterotoma TaxID=63436 RepID=UPI001CA918FB|nr:mitochondrial import receptor subunit TOM70 [Leptopilina heterotoma]XP_043478335.1 mitochondrial import receptor subunit TOM70 [Leptopilina heterotoma]